MNSKSFYFIVYNLLKILEFNIFFMQVGFFVSNKQIENEINYLTDELKAINFIEDRFKLYC